MSDPFIIAEIGSNWETIEDCLKSIEMASMCQADAVKFQLLSYEELYGRQWEDTFENQILGKECPIRKLPREWIPKLAFHAEANGIEFMCSAFSPEGYEFIDPYVKRHKIASMEITALDILEKVRALNKDVIYSTGGATREQIAVVEEMFISSKREIVKMYCVADYPTRTIDLEEICKLTYGGFSDHTLDVSIVPDWIGELSHIRYVEKHVDFVGSRGPDAENSLNGDEFELYMEGFRQHLLPSRRQALLKKCMNQKVNQWQRRPVQGVDGVTRWYRPLRN